MNAHAGTPRKHCRLGGSVAGIFTKCTKAPELWVGRHRAATAYTREGTLAHALAENLFHGVSPTLNSDHLVEGETVTVDAEMVQSVRDFHALIQGTADVCQWSVVEESFDLDPLWTDVGDTVPEHLYGTTDFAGIEDDLLHVVDLKYGKGVIVLPDWNAQLLFYALGAYYRAREVDFILADKIKYVKLTIFAPRQDGEKEWTITLLDLLMWAEETLKPAVNLIAAKQGTFLAGSHCKFCTGAAICPALYEKNVKIAQNSFPPLTDALDMNTPYLTPPNDLSDEEIGHALDQAELLSTWHKALQMEASSRLNRGRTVPGWKHIQKKGYRQWKDAFAVFQMLQGYGVRASEASTTPEILSPAQLEKKLRTLGLDPKLVDPHVHTPISGTTLVPESHPAPAVTSPTAAFTDVTEQD